MRETLVSRGVYEVLEAIRAANGGTLRPADVVEHARDPESPLHSHFEWDVELAAEAYLIDQARHLIRRAKVMVTTTESEPFFVRAYISIPSDETGKPVYYHESQVREDAELREQALAAMQRDWRILRKKWQTYHEFWAMVAGDAAEHGTET